MYAFFLVETDRLLGVGCALVGLRGIGLADERSATIFRVNDNVVMLLSGGTCWLLHCAYLIYLILLEQLMEEWTIEN